MKQFFKIFFASLLALIFGTILLFFILLGIISAFVSGAGEQKASISDNTILKIYLPDRLTERSSANPFRNFDFTSMEAHAQPGLNDILECIEKASKDSRIKGIYIDGSALQAGMAQTEELRNALIKFRKSGKFIYAYADAYSQGSYYLASAADKIYMNPQGALELHGLMTELMFFKGSFEKLEIVPILIRHGKYKSAGETFVMDHMSDDNRQQIAAFVDNIWNNIATQIAASRKIDRNELENIADSISVRTATDALRYKLVDKLAYFDEFISDINIAAGKNNREKLETISLNKYKSVPARVKEKFTSDRIAVIYASGEITGGDGDEETIGSDKLAETIRKARFDKNVKAIVLRVNSPGGSALASEVIWRETILAGKTKPLVISMSDLAASGGYYISCGATKIFAHQNTITGSIGVFGLLFNARQMLKNKLGITTDGYKTGIYTDLGLPTHDMSKAEEMMIQQSVDTIYNLFTGRVSAGRDIPQSLVDSLGQGRVWSGSDALTHHLIDTIGGLSDAVAYAAKLVKLDNYRIKALPDQKEPFKELLDDLSGDAQTWYEGKVLGEEVKYIKALKNAMKVKGVQARMDVDFYWQ